MPLVTNDSESVTEDSPSAETVTLTTSGEVTITETDQGEGSFGTAVTFVDRVNNGATGDATQLGNLEMHADGSYDYSVANSAVQYLGEGDSIVQHFTVKSFDGTATSTITITINGTNDVPTLGGDAESDVYESGLLSGSGVEPSTKTVTGSLVFGDSDTDDTLKLIVNGVEKGALDPDATDASTTVLGTTAGDYGTTTFYLDGSWSYTLDLNVDHDTDSTPVENFLVQVNDGTVNSSTVTLHIDINDDAPVAAENSRTMLESTSVDDPVVSDFSDSDQFLVEGQFFAAGSGNAAVEINGDGDIGFLRTGSDSSDASDTVGFINTNTTDAPNLSVANFVAVANGSGVGPGVIDFVQGSAFYVKDPNNLASPYTFTLDAQAIADNGGTASLSFDFNFLTNEGSWDETTDSWISGEGKNKPVAVDDTLFMVLVKYDESGTFESQQIVEVTSVYGAEDTYGYIPLSNQSYPFQTGTQQYEMSFEVSDAGSYQLYFMILDASYTQSDDKTALAIDNLKVNGGLITVVELQEISGNVITNADVITGGTDVAGADDIDRISKIQIGDDVFARNEDGVSWSLSTGGAGTNASVVSYDDTTQLLTLETDIGGTLKINVDGDDIGNYTYTAPINSGATTDAINYTVMDNDGSESTATLAINVLSQAIYENVVEGTAGSDTLSGTTETDYFVGGAGADTFNFGSGEQGTIATPVAETVKDFSKVEQDALDLSDVLPDAQTELFVYVTQDLAGTTVHITDGTPVNNGPDMSGAHDIQTVFLEGYTDDSIENILNQLTTNQTYTPSS